MKACRKIERKYYKYGNMPNVTVVGSPTINNGVISEFSTSNYATLPNSVDASVFEIKLKIKTSLNTSTGGQKVFAIGNQAEEGKAIGVFINNSGTILYIKHFNNATVNLGQIDISNNTDYYIKIISDGSNITSYISQSGFSNMAELATTTLTQPVQGTVYLGYEPYNTTKGSFKGSIDLLESNINVNNNDWWHGTIAETGIFYDTNVIFNGLPSVSSSAILSGFNSTSWVTLPNIFSPNSNNWEMLFKFKIGSLGVFQNIINSPVQNQPVTIRIDNNNYLLAKGFLNNTTTQVFSINGVTPLEAGINYWVKLDYNNQNGYTLKLSIDGETFITEGTSAVISSVTSGYKLALGVDFTTDGTYYGYPFTGSIDLKECYIKIADENWWTGATQQQATFSDYDFYKDILTYKLHKQENVRKYYKTVYTTNSYLINENGIVNSATGGNGWTIYNKNGYNEVYMMLNAIANTTYPRWQWQSPNVYGYIKTPQKCIITSYLTTQWCDGNETGRICNHWIIKGYETEEDLLALTNGTVIDDNTWGSRSKGTSKTVTLNNDNPFQYYSIHMVSNFAGGSYCSMGVTKFYAKLPYDIETTEQEAEYSKIIDVYSAVKTYKKGQVLHT